MQSMNKKDCEWTYVRKPLKVFVPLMGDHQARKNPFSRRLRVETLREPIRSALLSPKELEESKKPHSRTLSSAVVCKHCHLSPAQIPLPVQQITEVSDMATESVANWTTENEGEESPVASEHEDTKSELEFGTEKSPFRAVLSHEIKYNFRTMRSILPATAAEVALKAVNLDYDVSAGRSSKKTLILDLDDTLIHTINPAFNYAAIDVTHSEFQTVFYQEPDDPSIYTLHVVVRPYAVQLLEELSKIYEIVTSYADAILNLLDPEGTLISHRLYRDDCVLKSGIFLKDLRILRNRDLRKMVIVDNSILSFASHLSNGVHVPSYFGKKDDAELLQIISLMKAMADCENVQTALDEKVGLQSLYESYVQSQDGK